MQLIEFYGLMGVALLLFLIYDISSMRTETGFFPFTKGALGPYSLYTSIRLILVGGMYILLESNPSLFAVNLPDSLDWQWSIIAALVTPFLYLVLFKKIGGMVVRGVDIAAPIQAIMLDVRMDVAKFGMNAAQNKLHSKWKKTNPQDPLSGIQTCFCNNMSSLMDMQVPDCLAALIESKAATVKQCKKAGITGANQEKLVVSGWLSRIRRIAVNSDAGDKVHLSVLQICSN